VRLASKQAIRPAEVMLAGTPPDGGATWSPGLVCVIKRGTADLQPLLTSARADRRALAVVFVDAAQAAQERVVQWTTRSARRHHDIAWAQCDVNASSANRCALFPQTCSICSANARLIRRDVHKAGACGAHRCDGPGCDIVAPRRRQLAAKLGVSRGPKVLLSSAATAVVAPPWSEAATSFVARHSKLEPLPYGGDSSASHKQASDVPAASQAGKSAFDPPSNVNKAGAIRTFGRKGEGSFWPRMPCLRCGCPWWIGEDWDACCARCGWTCESDGYDDDSQPLKTGDWRQRHERFTECIRKGRTARWPPEV
jgi:hypothetical protein